MSDMIRMNLRCLVFRGPDDLEGELTSFEVDAEAHLSLGRVVREFLIAYLQSHLELPEARRPEIPIYVDEEVPLEQCVMVQHVDADGEPEERLSLDLVPARAGYGSGSTFQLSPGELVIGSAAEAGSSTRRLRIENELKELVRLAEANPDAISLLSPKPLGDVWRLSQPLVVRIYRRGWARGADGRIYERPAHDVRVSFPPRFPVEQAFRVGCVSDADPIYHPNVSPTLDRDGTGYYVCLYTDDVAPLRRSLVEAFVKLEALIGWRAANLDAVDAMNEEAAEHYRSRPSNARSAGRSGLRPSPRRLSEWKARDGEGRR